MPGKPSNPANRRSSQRLHPRRSVQVECRKGALGLGPNVAVRFLDIAEGGLRLITMQELPIDGEVEILLLGHGMRQAIKRLGTVCWSLPLEGGQFCAGVHFQKRLPYRDVQSLAMA